LDAFGLIISDSSSIDEQREAVSVLASNNRTHLTINNYAFHSD